VVQEKYGSLCGSGIWKIPTGVVDEGEEIFAAAIREVKEETGVRRSIYLNVNQSTINIYNLTFSYIYLQIDTEFLEILAFWYGSSSYPLLVCFIYCFLILSRSYPLSLLFAAKPTSHFLQSQIYSSFVS